MNTKAIHEAKNEDLRTSLAALQRASRMARITALQTGTHLVIVKDGKLQRMTADEMRASLGDVVNPMADQAQK